MRFHRGGAEHTLICDIKAPSPKSILSRQPSQESQPRHEGVPRDVFLEPNNFTPEQELGPLNIPR